MIYCFNASIIVVVETVQTLNRKITYAHPTVHKRNAHTLVRLCIPKYLYHFWSIAHTAPYQIFIIKISFSTRDTQNICSAKKHSSKKPKAIEKDWKINTINFNFQSMNILYTQKIVCSMNSLVWKKLDRFFF